MILKSKSCPSLIICVYIYIHMCVCLCKYIRTYTCVSCVYTDTHPCRLYLNIRSSRGSKLFARGNNVKDFTGQLPTAFSHAGYYFRVQITSLSGMLSRNWEVYLIPHIATTIRQLYDNYTTTIRQLRRLPHTKHCAGKQQPCCGLR